MPAQPACFHRLDEILSDLRSMTSTHLDRAAVEKLFRVRQRRARQIGKVTIRGKGQHIATAEDFPDLMAQEKTVTEAV